MSCATMEKKKKDGKSLHSKCSIFVCGRMAPWDRRSRDVERLRLEARGGIPTLGLAAQS